MKRGITSAAEIGAFSLAFARRVTVIGVIGTVTAPAWLPLAADIRASVAICAAGKMFLDKVW